MSEVEEPVMSEVEEPVLSEAEGTCGYLCACRYRSTA
jgi:hypothetical protein